jgi:pimeloyl-ACP methyl ester carboxylesterase
VVAVDLPIEDREATFADYAASVPDCDVVVGHSMGGITASLVAARCGARVVYVAAMQPRAGTPLKDLFAEQLCPGLELERRDGLDYFTDAGARARGLDPAHLRGQALAPYFAPLDDPTPGTYIACARDQVVRPDFQASVADVTLDCGHLPQIECPEALAALL